MVKASDCDSEDRRFKSALSPHRLPLPIKRGLYASLAVSFQKPSICGRVAEWFKAPSWKGGEGNTSASSNLVSSSKETYIGSRGNGERRAI